MATASAKAGPEAGPEAGPAAAQNGKVVRKRTLWRDKEVRALMKAVRVLGVGSWTRICRHPVFGGKLARCTPENLRDKWRSMLCKHGLDPCTFRGCPFDADGNIAKGFCNPNLGRGAREGTGGCKRSLARAKTKRRRSTATHAGPAGATDKRARAAPEVPVASVVATAGAGSVSAQRAAPEGAFYRPPTVLYPHNDALARAWACGYHLPPVLHGAAVPQRLANGTQVPTVVSGVPAASAAFAALYPLRVPGSQGTAGDVTGAGGTCARAPVTAADAPSGTAGAGAGAGAGAATTRDALPAASACVWPQLQSDGLATTAWAWPGAWPGTWPGAWPGAWPGTWPGDWPGAWPGVWPGTWPSAYNPYAGWGRQLAESYMPNSVQKHQQQQPYGQ